MKAKPASILVLPPLNTSVDVAASAAVLSQATLPLAESGYYVVPVAVMEETFRQNGLTTPDDIHAVPAARLREIFGADAALYMTVKEYGASYKVVSSDVTVSIDATLLDLQRRAGRPPDPEARQQQQQRRPDRHAGAGGGGSGGQLVVGSSYGVAGMTSNALLSAGTQGGILYGPRSPRYAGSKPFASGRVPLAFAGHQAPFAVLNRRAGFRRLAVMRGESGGCRCDGSGLAGRRGCPRAPQARLPFADDHAQHHQRAADQRQRSRSPAMRPKMPAHTGSPA